MPRNPVLRSSSHSSTLDGESGSPSEEEEETHGNLQHFLLHLIARGLLAPQAAIRTDEIISDYRVTKRARVSHHQPGSIPNMPPPPVLPGMLPSPPLDSLPNGGSNYPVQSRAKSAAGSPPPPPPLPPPPPDATDLNNGVGTGELTGVDGLWQGTRSSRNKMRNKGIECKEEGCTKEAAYGPDKGEPMYCSEHKKAEDVDLEDARCVGDAFCSRKRRFNFRGLHPMFCIKHKQKGMVNLVVRRCFQPSCTKVPCYGMQGQRAERCVEHKTEGMVNVASRRCRDPTCTRLAHYNFSEQKSKLTCMEHKLEGMVNLSNKRCKHDGCMRWPYYEFPGNTPKWCSYHKVEGMIDVKNRRCQFDKCQHFATYGHGTGRARFCLSHKEAGMKCLLKKQCEEEGCTRAAQFGLPGDKAKVCEVHKTEDMVVVRLKRNRSSRSEVSSAACESDLQAEVPLHADVANPDVPPETSRHVGQDIESVESEGAVDAEAPGSSSSPAMNGAVQPPVAGAIDDHGGENEADNEGNNEVGGLEGGGSNGALVTSSTGEEDILAALRRRRTSELGNAEAEGSERRPSAGNPSLSSSGPIGSNSSGSAGPVGALSGNGPAAAAMMAAAASAAVVGSEGRHDEHTRPNAGPPGQEGGPPCASAAINAGLPGSQGVPDRETPRSPSCDLSRPSIPRTGMRRELHQIAPQPPRLPSISLPGLLPGVGMPGMAGSPASGGLHLAALLQQQPALLLPVGINRFQAAGLPGPLLPGSISGNMRDAPSQNVQDTSQTTTKDVSSSSALDKHVSAPPTASTTVDGRSEKV